MVHAVMIRTLLRRFLKTIIFCAFLIAVAVFSGMMTMHYIFALGDVNVPDVTNQDMVVAVDLLVAQHLKLKAVDAQFDQDVKFDHIISQDPPAGTTSHKNQVVRVVLSKGTESSTIPNVMGKRIQEARRLLRKSPFRVGNLAYIHTDEAPVDYIVAQNPLAGIEGHMGDSIDLLVSLGPYRTILVMPDLVQEQLAYGMQVIGKLGLVLGKVERDPEYPLPLPPDTIISQVPKPGTLVEEQNLVNLVVTGTAAPAFELSSEPSLPISYQTIEYTVPVGSFDREVMVMVRNAEGVSEVFRQRVPSGRQLLLRLPVIGETVMEVYLDSVLDDIRRIESQ